VVNDGQRDAVVDGDVDHEITRAASFLVRPDRTVEDHEKIHVAVFTGFSACLRAFVAHQGGGHSGTVR
jgi:hypothetical protein